MAKSEQKQLPKHLFDSIQKECPEFLKSYIILASFYTAMNENYTRKVWKDGRLVLTPIKKPENGNQNTEKVAKPESDVR